MGRGSVCCMDTGDCVVGCVKDDIVAFVGGIHMCIVRLDQMTS